MAVEDMTMTPHTTLDASAADLRAVADRLSALADQLRPPPEPEPEPVPEPPLTAFGVRFGYGPAAATVPEAIADVQAVAALPPLVTQAEAQQFSVDFRTNSTSDTRRWREKARYYRRAEVRARIARGLTGLGVGNRMHSFWADHFTTVPESYQTYPMQVSFTEEAIRLHIAGRFADMLKAADLHPQMLLFLDQIASVGDNSPHAMSRPGTGLNENLGRELIELHTIGVAGSYTQDDVREASNLLAGMIYSAYAGVRYDASRAEPGTETVLGVEYPDDSIAEIHRMMDDLARHPATARHLATKLVVHFLGDEPVELIDEMAAAYLANDTALVPVYEVLFAHRSFPGSKLRKPLDWMIASLLALGVTPAEVEALPSAFVNTFIITPLGVMGQPWDGQGGPDGWPEQAEAWLAPNQLAARLDWAMTAPTALFTQLGRMLPDPRLPSLTENTALWVGRAQSPEAGIAAMLTSPDVQRS